MPIVAAAFRRGLQRARLDRGSEHRDRVSLGGGSATTGCRASAAELVRLEARRHRAPYGTRCAARCQAGDPTIPIVFANGGDPVGSRPRRQSGAAGRQRHRLELHGARSWAANGSNCCVRSCPACRRVGDLVQSGQSDTPSSSERCRGSAAPTLGIDAVTSIEMPAQPTISMRAFAAACKRRRRRAFRRSAIRSHVSHRERIVALGALGADCRRCYGFESLSKRAV